MPIYLAVSSLENSSGNESSGFIGQDDWHLSDNMDNTTTMRGQSLPASKSDPMPVVDGPAQLQVHEEPEGEQDAESSSNSHAHSDQRQPDEVWREYHPLLTGK